MLQMILFIILFILSCAAVTGPNDPTKAELWNFEPELIWQIDRAGRTELADQTPPLIFFKGHVYTVIVDEDGDHPRLARFRISLPQRQ